MNQTCQLICARHIRHEPAIPTAPVGSWDSKHPHERKNTIVELYAPPAPSTTQEIVRLWEEGYLPHMSANSSDLLRYTELSPNRDRRRQYLSEILMGN